MERIDARTLDQDGLFDRLSRTPCDPHMDACLVNRSGFTSDHRLDEHNGETPIFIIALCHYQIPQTVLQAIPKTHRFLSFFGGRQSMKICVKMRLNTVRQFMTATRANRTLITPQLKIAEMLIQIRVLIPLKKS